jgi:MSHA biogenesis protein MshP
MSRSAQRGVGAITIIAILVILAALGAGLVTTITSQQSALALDVLAARTYQSAKAGLEYGIHHVLRGTMTCAAVNGTTFGGLAGIRVTLACTPTTHTEGTSTVTMAVITATACTASAGTCPQAATTPHYVERQLRVSIGSD